MVRVMLSFILWLFFPIAFLAAIIVAVRGPMTSWAWMIVEGAAAVSAASLIIPGWRRIVKDNLIKGPIVAICAVAMGTSIIAYVEAPEGIPLRTLLIFSVVEGSLFVICSLFFVLARRHAFRKEVLRSGTSFVVCCLLAAYSGRLISILADGSFAYWLSFGILFAAIAGISNVIAPIVEEAVNRPSKDDPQPP